MPLPSRLHAASVRRPGSPGPNSKPRRGLEPGPLLLIVAALLLLGAAVSYHASVMAAQAEVSEADLERSSVGRSVMVGSPSGGGRPVSLALELYVARVLAGEGEPTAPRATQQALAIAVRTFAMANRGRHRREGFDLCDTTHCQVPRAATAASREAAQATAGRILTYNGAPAEVFYSASCGGRTESASEVWPRANFPYLRSVVDDVHAEDVPWTLEMTLREVQQALEPVGFAGDELKDVVVEGRSESGRALRIRLVGLRPNAIAGEPFRAAIGQRMLRSTAFTLDRRGDTLRFTGRGYGHGVGMCVVGAGRRARRGEDVDDILRAYYPGLQISSKWQESSR